MQRLPEVRALLLIVAFSVLPSLLLMWPASVLAQGTNLLQNPGFEHPYAVLPGKENCAVAAPWVAWYIQGSPEEVSQGYRFAPEYKAAFRADFPGNRVRNGELAQQWFHSYGNFEAGVYQQVPNIAVGAKLRFELWGMTWSCDKESKGNCSNATSGDPSPMHFRIGIDPTGGSDVFSPAILWSPEQNAYDAWQHFEVEAVAQKSTVTVFVYTYPTYRSQDNNVYLDDASLVVIQPPPTATRRPTKVPTVTPIPTDTPLPTNTPVPTATPLPTDTPVPTVTLTPTSTPVPTNTPTSVPSPTRTSGPTPAPTLTRTPRVNQLLSIIAEQGPLVFIPVAAVIIVLLIWLLLGPRHGRSK